MAPTTRTSLYEYMRQYAQVATDGNVTVEFAQLVDRMQLYCHVCHQALTVPRPGSAEKVDWAMQEFLKLHRHAQTDGQVPPKKNYTTFSQPKAVTADFKSVKKDDWGISTGRKFR